MRLTPRHLEYWTQRRAPRPSWARAIVRERQITIDEMINLNAGLRLPSDISNTLVLLRGRTGEALYARLAQLARSPGTTIRPGRRAGSCARWLQRLTGERIETQDFRAHRARVSAMRLVDRLFPPSDAPPALLL